MRSLKPMLNIAAGFLLAVACREAIGTEAAVLGDWYYTLSSYVGVVFAFAGSVALLRNARRSISGLWSWGGFLFGARVRNNLWTPAIEQLREEHFETSQYEGAARVWLTFCFALRTAHVFVLACWEQFMPKAMRDVIAFISKITSGGK